ncbi:MAG: repressor [Sphingomonas bacterium]|nr:repressor [Sphingomonas bacterium]
MSDMEALDPRPALDALITERGVGYAALSRMIGRNEAYLQQFIKRGTPRSLAERDRRLLAAFLRVDEEVLGGPPGAAPPTIRRLDLAASAGPGTLADDDRLAGSMVLDSAILAGRDPARLSLLPARGDSMLPLIHDGDMMLVDETDRAVGARGGIHVIRLDGALVVKRVSVKAGQAAITSDNPDYPPIAPRPAAEVEIIGRVVWLSRSLA